ELDRLNQIVSARDSSGWRMNPVTLQISTGKTQRFNVISNPLEDARRILGNAGDLAYNEDPKVAATYVYLQLVEEHLFQDGNRRTAALAAQWVLNAHDTDVDVLQLLELPLGDVRDSSEREALSQKIKAIIKSA